VVTDVAGDHVSKSQERTRGDFGAPHCSLLSDSITWFFEQRQVSSMRFWIAFQLPNGTRLYLGVPASPHPAFGTPLPRAGEGKGVMA